MVTTSLHDPMIWSAYGIAKAAPAKSLIPGREWEIYITSSTPDLDMEGERVQQAALKRAAPYYLARGRLTWEHVTAESRFDPSIYIGQPLDVVFPPDGRTLEKGWLYQSPNKPKAREAWGILESGGSLHASIGGLRLGKDEDTVVDGVPVITNILWTHTALTPYPINNFTNVQTVPFVEFYRALGVSSAVPMIREDLEGAVLRGTPDFAQVALALIQVLRSEYPDLELREAKELARRILHRRGADRPAHVVSILPVS